MTYFAYQPRRVNCPRCGIKVEKVPWSDGKNQLTNTLQWFLSSWAKEISWQAVACRFKVSWDSVCKSVEMAVEWGLENRELENIKSIGVDEVAHSKGHKYITLVYQIDKGMRRLLWIGENRTESSFRVFFEWFGSTRSAKIEAVCSDMWKAYLNIIKEKIPDALHVLDRFHIAQHLNKEVDKVRAEEQRRLVKDGYESILFKSRWLLLKGRKNLGKEQEASLRQMLKYNLKTMRAFFSKKSSISSGNIRHQYWQENF